MGHKGVRQDLGTEQEQWENDLVLMKRDCLNSLCCCVDLGKTFQLSETQIRSL